MWPGHSTVCHIMSSYTLNIPLLAVDKITHHHHTIWSFTVSLSLLLTCSGFWTRTGWLVWQDLHSLVSGESPYCKFWSYLSLCSVKVELLEVVSEDPLYHKMCINMLGLECALLYLRSYHRLVNVHTYMYMHIGIIGIIGSMLWFAGELFVPK